jgi:multiple sugar transport system substrate-binding protein
MAPAYQKATGVKIDYQIAAAGGTVVPQLVSIVENRSPVDLAWVQVHWLYVDKLLDVHEIAEEAGKKNGGWYDNVKDQYMQNGRWKAIPHGNIGQLMVWRKDWFDEAGVKKFPETWDEFLEAGIKLKAKGHPFGMSMGHGFADNNGWILPLLWSYGARVTEKDGKTVVLDSNETARAVDYARKLYKETMIEDCVGWLDPANNKAFLTQQISCTNNALSILISAKRDLPELGKVVEHSLNPKGPNGQRYHFLNSVAHGIFSHTKEPQAAKDFLRWLMQPKQLNDWYASGETYFAPFLHGFDKAPMWNADQRFKPFQQVVATGRNPSWPAPPSRASGEVFSRWVIADMIAKACTGQSTKAVIADATGQLKEIYRRA